MHVWGQDLPAHILSIRGTRYYFIMHNTKGILVGSSYFASWWLNYYCSTFHVILLLLKIEYYLLTFQTNDNLQNITLKTTHESTRTPLKTEGTVMCSGGFRCSCSSCDTRRVTVKRHDHHLIYTASVVEWLRPARKKVGSIRERVKPKTIKYVSVASPLST